MEEGVEIDFMEAEDGLEDSTLSLVNKTSCVWNHFTFTEDGKRATCVNCKSKESFFVRKI
jgi:hypothetical protein